MWLPQTKPHPQHTNKLKNMLDMNFMIELV